MTSERQPVVPNTGYEPPRRVSAEDYLRLESRLATRHEYWHGWMYPRMHPPGSHWAMAGGTLAHARLIIRLLGLLDAHLSDGRCVVYTGDVRLYVTAEDYFYPDAFVICDGPTAPGLIEQHDAVLVVEVRSPSTAAFDQGDKLDAYSVLPSLREYLILDTRRMQATVYRRPPSEDWTRTVVLAGADLGLESINFHLPLARLYHGVRLEPETEDEGIG
ncbi:MAG: Uma2 family endonuclease [Chloroflexota bacterium]